MILILNIDNIQLQKMNVLVEQLPPKLVEKIKKIYCITDSPNKAKYKTLFHKPILYFTNDKESQESLIHSLKQSNTLFISSNVKNNIIEILKTLKNYQIFIEKDEKNNPRFVENKDLFLKIILEIKLIIESLKRFQNITIAKGEINFPISQIYNRQKIRQEILIGRKRCILQFDKFHKIDKSKRFIFENTTLGFLLADHGQFVKKTIHSKLRTIELLLGVEYLDEVEQQNLVDLIKEKASENLYYRIIVNGEIPKIILLQNYRVIQFGQKNNSNKQNVQEKNISYIFYSALSETLKKYNYRGKVLDFSEFIINDSFKNLLKNFPSQNAILEALVNKVRKDKKRLVKPINPTDINFWYDLLYNPQHKRKVNQKKLPSKKSKTNRIVEKVSASSHEIELTTSPRNITLAKDEPNVKELKFEIVKNKWKISIDGQPIGGSRNYSLKGIHLIKKLVESHNSPNKSIDATDLDEFLYNKLPEKETFRIKKIKTETKKTKSKRKSAKSKILSKTPTEIVLNRLRENIKTLYSGKYKKLDFLWKENWFELGEGGCYYKQRDTLFINFPQI